jgi:cell wall-associated NlpC family hydrolase
VTATPSGIAEVTGRMAAIQSMIASLASGSTPFAVGGTGVTGSAPTGSTGGSTPSATATAFSEALAQANSAIAPRTLASVGAAVTGPASGTATGTATGTAAVAQAKSYLGVPYVWGGESRDGIDCSGLVQSSFGALGIDLPRTAAEQQRVGTSVASVAQAQPGDLLFFGKPAHHVAIYLGNNQLIEAPQAGQTVSIRDVYETPASISRVAPTGAAPTFASSPSANGSLAAGVNAAVAGYAPQFAAAEAKYVLPTGLLSAVAQQESAGNPRAVSKAGAEGLMQLMPATAAAQGVDPFDPNQAIDAAGRILAGNLSRFGGSVPLALAAYNAGAGAVQQYGGIPPYAETQQYVRKITTRLAAS